MARIGSEQHRAWLQTLTAFVHQLLICFSLFAVPLFCLELLSALPCPFKFIFFAFSSRARWMAGLLWSLILVQVRHRLLFLGWSVSAVRPEEYVM